MPKTTLFKADLAKFQRLYRLNNVVLTQVFGVGPQHVSQWRSSGMVPRYVLSWCKLHAEHEGLKARIREALDG